MNNYYFKPGASYKEIGIKIADLCTNKQSKRPLVVLCIGTDRCTGDSLGPLVGYMLNGTPFDIYGSLEAPVHAVNLKATMNTIYSKYNNPFIIAIDASLGKKESIGCITVGTGPLKPGLGVNKDLPQVGDIHITGIVNTKNGYESVILQTTRLNTVIKIADTIANALRSHLSA